jgi:hypothetical protein
MAEFTIPGRLPGTNEIIEAAKSHYGAYSTMKKTYTEMVAWAATRLPVMGAVQLIITWYEPNEKRDPDNITGGQKFILDGMVMVGKIPNDTRRYIKGIEHRYEVDRVNPRVEVTVIDVKEV